MRDDIPTRSRLIPRLTSSLNSPDLHQSGAIDYFLTTDETRRFQYLLFLLFLAPQVSKSVNDDTKDEVEDNDDDHEEEKQVVDHSGSKKGLLLNPNT